MRPIPRQPLTTASLGAALALFASPAFAADVAWCGTPEEMSALMREEGQRSLAVGNQDKRFEIDAEGNYHWNEKQVGLIFTADLDGRVGYLIQTDEPIGTPATKSCIALRFHDVRLYDARVPGVPPETLIDSTEEAALARCAALDAQYIVAKGSCGFHNKVLEISVPFGEGVLLQGYSAVRQSDGTWATERGLVTVTLTEPGNGRDRDGERLLEADGIAVIHYTALPEGAIVIGSVLVDTRYTQQALDMLEARDNGIATSALLMPR